MGTLLILPRCVCLISVILIVVKCEWPYTEYILETDRLCTLGYQNKVIEIGKDAKSGAIVEETSYFDSLTGKFHFNCQFIVKSTHEMGIFAVIQKMKLRKNETTGECIDFIQFRHTNSIQIGFININTEKDETAWSEKHCGTVEAAELELSSLNPNDFIQTLPHAFVDKQGKMDVRIYIANKTIKRGTLDLKIAFTSFFVCRFDLGTTYKKCGSDSCIWYKYFNDGILNCPYTSCADENGCRILGEAGIRPSAGLATKVMVGAVAGVFTMFVVFVIFLWLFRHCNLCWNDSLGNAQTITQMRPVPTMEDIQPTAPPRIPQLDKDLPPSYESLFPTS